MEEPSLEWLQRIVDGREPESTTLEFKRELPGPTDRDRKDYLADIVGMANSGGGRIVYGIEEDADARATRISLLSGSADESIRRLRSMFTDGSEPRLYAVDVRAVEVDQGFVLVVTIAYQFDGPFRTNFRGSHRFHYRDGAQNHDMSYAQIRDAFGRKGRVLDQLRSWRATRLGVIKQEIAVRQLSDKPWMILHIMPLISFAEPFSLDLQVIKASGYSFPQTQHGYPTYNLDGLKFAAEMTPKPEETVQFFRHGAVEVAWDARIRGMDTAVIASGKASYRTRQSIKNIAKLLHDNGVEGPCVFALSLLNAQSYRLSYMDRDGCRRETTDLPIVDAVMPEIMVDQLEDAFSRELDTVTRPMLDVLWQTFDVDECTQYRDGVWVEV